MHSHHEHDAAGGAVIDDADKAICPVMHIPTSKKAAADKGLVRNYDGRNLYLCCGTCGSIFDNNPKQYINDKEDES